MSDRNAISVLAQLLSESKAKPIINPHRFAPSAVYDLEYRMFIVGASFAIHAKPVTLDRKRIATSRLKLLQFVAFRPWLIPVIRSWSQTRGQAQQTMFSPVQLRRGFLSDTTFDQVVDFLVARRVLERTGTHLIEAEAVGFLKGLYASALEMGLFDASVRALKEMTEITVTNDMLEGW